MKVTNADFLVQIDGCCDLQFMSCHSQPWRSTLPWFGFDLSVFPVLPFEHEVLPLFLVLDLNRPGLDSDRLECHPEAPRAHNAITACVQVEVPLQAMPAGPKSFLDNQRQAGELRYCQNTFFAPAPL